MAFNFKKQAQTPNISDQSSLDSYIQMLITQLNQTGSMPTEEAINEIARMDSLSQYADRSFEDLRDMIKHQMEAMEQQEAMQNNMVSPPQEPGAPVILEPSPVTAKGKNKMIKSFNLKKAQLEEYYSSYPVEQMEIENEKMDELNVPQPPFQKVEDFMRWADNTSQFEVLQAFTTPGGDELKERMEGYFTTKEEGDKAIIAGGIFKDPNFPLGGNVFMAQETHIGSVNEVIKKLAQNIVNKNKKKAFNLTKTAQHKTLDNAILWGPGQTRIDPFLHQPVSDWHIVERNKGFGLVVDDIWNIDYETIWRENIMDKYSRPYKNKEGDWVGGYLNKRFEIDRNIPVASNMQLKPGQLRKPILPEYGNTESRLQAARASGDIAGAIDISKPFNWKEASSKKKS